MDQKLGQTVETGDVDVVVLEVAVEDDVVVEELVITELEELEVLDELVSLDVEEEAKLELDEATVDRVVGELLEALELLVDDEARPEVVAPPDEHADTVGS